MNTEHAGEKMSTMIESFGPMKEAVRPRTYSRSIAADGVFNDPKEVSLQFIVGNHEIDIRLLNSASISALQFEVTFQKRYNYEAPELSPRVQGLNSHIGFQGNVLTFALLDKDGKGIAPGDGTILKLPIDADQDFDVSGAYASTHTRGITGVEYTVSKNALSEESLILGQNDSNPLSGMTKLAFQIPVESDTKLIIYDAGGALIKTLIDSTLSAGMHLAEWDGRDDCATPVQSGIYLCRLYAGVHSVTKKMAYLK